MGSNNAMQAAPSGPDPEIQREKERQEGRTIKNAELYNDQFQNLANSATAAKSNADVGTNNLVNRLTAQATGTAPSLADLQLKAANDRNLSQQVAAAAAARGGAPAALQRQAMMNAGMNQRNAANQGAQARLQEGMAANQQLGSVLGNEQNNQGAQALQATQGGFNVNKDVTAAAEKSFNDFENSKNAAKQTANAGQQKPGQTGLGAIAGAIPVIGSLFSDEDSKDNVKKSDDDHTLDSSNAPKPSFLEAVSKFGTNLGGKDNPYAEVGNNLAGLINQVKSSRSSPVQLMAGGADVQPVVAQPQIAAPFVPNMGGMMSDQQAKYRVFKEDINNPVKPKMSFLEELLSRDANPDSGMNLLSDVNTKQILERGENPASGMNLENTLLSDENFKSAILKENYKGIKSKPKHMSYSDENTKDSVRKPSSRDPDPDKVKKYGFEKEFGGQNTDYNEKAQDWIKKNNPFSDEDTKDNVKDNKSEPEHKVQKFLDAIKPATYEYKPEYQQKPNDKGEQVGIIAQDIEKGGPAGKNMVVKGPDDMKMIDTVKGFGSVLAALGDLHSRMKELEAKKGKKD